MSADLKANASAHLADLFDRCGHVVVAFSGGKESVVLADLCAPWRDRLTLAWVRTSAAAPHMVNFVRSYDASLRMLEIEAPDVATSWREHGTPADVMTAEMMTDFAGPVRLQAWQACCGRIRFEPLLRAVGEMADGTAAPVGLVLGQRAEDRGITPERLARFIPPNVVGSFPLFDWSTAGVLAYVAERGLGLPSQYAVGLDSLECVSCPGAMTEARMAYLRREYPEAAGTARAAMLRAIGPTMEAVERLTRIAGA